MANESRLRESLKNARDTYENLLLRCYENDEAIEPRELDRARLDCLHLQNLLALIVSRGMPTLDDGVSIK